MKSFAKGILLAAAACLTVGCASFVDVESARDRVGVKAITMAYIESTKDHAATAARVAQYADELETFVDVADVSVKDIRVALLARIAESDLTPLETLAAQEMIVEPIAAEIEKRLGSGVLLAADRVTVNTVLGWVKEATVFYVSD